MTGTINVGDFNTRENPAMNKTLRLPEEKKNAFTTHLKRPAPHFLEQNSTFIEHKVSLPLPSNRQSILFKSALSILFFSD